MDFGLIATVTPSGINWAWWWAIAQMVLGLGAVIFVHELGHFLVAKACGVKCEKFYLGFDAFDIRIGRLVLVPRALLKWKAGETEYGIGILPLGGYVKMLGQDDNPSQIADERRRSQIPAHEVSAGSLDLETTAVGPIDRSKLDPRSYQAKTVLQRMAIISAGVVMNLIFSVIFATIAFRIGVNYQPPVIGQTLPGSPAHIANLDGAEIVSINGRNTTNSYYTFQHFVEEIILNGNERPIDLEVQYSTPGKSSAPIKKTVTPTLNLNPEFPDIASVGASSAASNELGKNGALKGQAAAAATPPLGEGDRVVSINGQPIEDLTDMRTVLAMVPDQPVTMIVERSAAEGREKTLETVEVHVPTNAVVDFGLMMELGPIVAIQDDSPAKNSDLQVGDIIDSIDGEPTPDAPQVPWLLLQAARKNAPVRLGIRRPSTANGPQTTEVTLTPRLPARYQLHGNTLAALDGLGVVVQVTNRIRAVEADGAAAEAGLQAGDLIVGARFELDEETKKDPFFRGTEDVVFAAGFVGWLNVYDAAQMIRPPQAIKLSVERDGKDLSVTVMPRVSTTRFTANRGILPNLMEHTYQAEAWWEALQLGADRTYRDMGRVLQMLEKLVRGQVAIKHLGGPLTIADAATSEASQGTSRLLLFLTLLGANLAILNFLPIPILDGGHMMFLAYEGIFRRPVNERVQIILSFIGLFFIVGLMLLAISLDLGRYLF